MTDGSQTPFDTAAGANATADVTADAGQGDAVPVDAVGRPSPRKLREGTVVSNAMDKTVIVSVVDRVRHARYAKTMQRTKRLYVHDETNEARVGDRVRVQETRPLSKQKRWRLVEVLERAR